MSTREPKTTKGEEILVGLKEIADFLGWHSVTVQRRLKVDRDLAKAIRIRRTIQDGRTGTRNLVFAYVSEMEAYRRAQPTLASKHRAVLTTSRASRPRVAQ